MSPLHLFEGFGIEIEYMITDRESLAIRPIADKLLASAAGKIVNDYEDGAITWSNELALHVIEFKTTKPAKTLKGLSPLFQESLLKAQDHLNSLGCKLVPTGMHPTMDPATEVKLWPHDNNEIYDAYNRIFNCQGHGWSNLQSTHINLPFANDKEFGQLHRAIRFLLPLLPALCASTPVYGGKIQQTKSSRLTFYEKNQKRIPSITGDVIPEPIGSIEDYEETILKPMYKDITPFDPDGILQEDWLNSRGAIARFERQSIEIRILDNQEHPGFDIACADFITAILKVLVDAKLVSLESQDAITNSELKSVFDQCVKEGEEANLMGSAYLKAWSLGGSITTARDLLKKLLETVPDSYWHSKTHQDSIQKILSSGSLATRIRSALGKDPKPEAIIQVYHRLSDCLLQGQMFQA